MEQLTPQEKEHTPSHYWFLTKTFLIFSILTANPQWYSMILNKNNTYENLLENIDIQTNKKIIEESIKKTISELKTLDQLPLRISYPTKWIKNAPDIIDINPKKISSPIKWISITLGKRIFYIEPIVWKITNIRLEERKEWTVITKVLILETSYLDKEYSEQRLWELCSKLLETSDGKWEKPGFRGTNVKQL